MVSPPLLALHFLSLRSILFSFIFPFRYFSRHVFFFLRCLAFLPYPAFLAFPFSSLSSILSSSHPLLSHLLKSISPLHSSLSLSLIVLSPLPHSYVIGFISCPLFAFPAISVDLPFLAHAFLCPHLISPSEFSFFSASCPSCLLSRFPPSFFPSFPLLCILFYQAPFSFSLHHLLPSFLPPPSPFTPYHLLSFSFFSSPLLSSPLFSLLFSYPLHRRISISLVSYPPFTPLSFFLSSM